MNEANLGQICFYAAAGIFVLFEAWRGWRLGAVRGLVRLAALAAAYGAAIAGGRLLVPLLRPLGMPDALLGVLGGALLGIAVYLVIGLTGGILFKRTGQQSVGLIRFGYGLGGAVIGGLFGLFLVWVAVLAVRVLGTLAESGIVANEAAATVRVAPPPAERETPRTGELPVVRVPEVARAVPVPKPVPEPPNALVRRLVAMKQILEQGASGAVVEQVDPIPEAVYASVSKIGQIVSSPQSVERFLAYPGVRELTVHPKIVGLRDDPEIARDIGARSYLKLVRNERIVAAANDVELGEKLRRLEFEKALDYAVRKPNREEPLLPRTVR
ncbi:MAG: hypothetical protein M3463_14945 [Verrucomicrobiota bacterium]|nr:hypothetical protein [Verrucomicrobiota bacterium]